MRRFERCNFCYHWWYKKVQKNYQEHMTFFASIHLYQSYTPASHPVKLFECKLVEDVSKRTVAWICPISLFGTWNIVFPNRYFFAFLLYDKYPHFTMILYCPSIGNDFLFIDDPWKTLGKMQFHSITYLMTSSGTIANILFFFLHLPSINHVVKLLRLCIFLNTGYFTMKAS